MRRSIFPYLVKKFCLGLLMAMCITSIMVFPASASAEAATVDLEDGEYSIEVILEGGSGRATITSPAIMTVRGGKGYVQIEWSSPNSVSYTHLFCCGLLRDCSVWPLITSSSPKVTAPEETGRQSNGKITMSMIFWILTDMFA